METILDIDEIKKQLDSADIRKDCYGEKIQTIYLGSILNLLPSGKCYTPFANSNVKLCTRCNGKGEIKNRHGKVKKYKRAMKKFRDVWITTENVELWIKLRRQINWWNPIIICPECKGMGSMEARKDQDWWDELEFELDKIDAWSHGSEGDGCDILISRKVNSDGESK